MSRAGNLLRWPISSWPKMSSDQAGYFLQQRLHSRYSVARSYHPSMSSTFRTVLYIPAAVSLCLPQAGRTQARGNSHIFWGIHKNNGRQKKWSGEAGGCVWMRAGWGGYHQSFSGDTSSGLPVRGFALNSVRRIHSCWQGGSWSFQWLGSSAGGWWRRAAGGGSAQASRGTVAARADEGKIKQTGSKTELGWTSVLIVKATHKLPQCRNTTERNWINTTMLIILVLKYNVYNTNVKWNTTMLRLVY